jgi:O-antigen ligase
MSQLGGLAIFLLSAGAYILTANIITDIKWLKRLTLIFIVLTAGYILVRFVFQMDRSLGGWMPRGSTGSLLFIWMAALAFSQFLLNRDLKLIWRIALLGFVGVIFYVAIIGDFGWKSGWIPPLAAVGMVLWFRYPRLRIILGIGGVLAIWMISAELIQSDQYSYITRIEAWKIILNEIIKVNPLLGLGPANYRFYTPLFPIMGYYVEFNSHNNYIDILAQVGLLGLIAFLWFAWEVFRLGWGLLKQELDSFSQAYVAGALGGLVGMLVAGMLGDWVLPFVYNVGMRGFRSSVLGWIFLGGLVVIGRIAMAEKTNSLQE